MLVRVLGSAAGGGFPQWNCTCHNCSSVRASAPGFKARTQSSLAVSRDGKDWVLLNASPDLRQQIACSEALQASATAGLRNSPIKAVVVTNADVDHISGLIHLREAQTFTLYATERVLDVIGGNSVFNILAVGVVPRVALPLETPVQLAGAGVDLGLKIEAFLVPGKVALYLEDTSAGPGFGTQDGDTIGLKISDAATGEVVFYIPGCAKVDDALRNRIKGASAVFFDGTLYDDAEMIRQGLLDKTGNRMGHISISGTEGSVAAFEPLGVKRKIYVHINNSNPVLDEASPERRSTEAAGWEIGFDGMEVRL
jgi:pyrroloquinoline quinone biosynthesis protein B